MIDRFLPLGLFGLGMGILLIVLTRFQSAKYQRYLSDHTAESTKIREGQAQMIAQQDRAIAVAERNAVALERIAAALERDRA